MCTVFFSGADAESEMLISCFTKLASNVPYRLRGTVFAVTFEPYELDLSKFPRDIKLQEDDAEIQTLRKRTGGRHFSPPYMVGPLPPEPELVYVAQFRSGNRLTGKPVELCVPHYRLAVGLTEKEYRALQGRSSNTVLRVNVEPAGVRLGDLSNCFEVALADR